MKKRSLKENLREDKAQPTASLAAVCWYVPQEWTRVKAAAVDPEKFENSFEEWETMANEAFASIRAQHVNAFKAFVSADALLDWCKAEGKVNNASSRAEFASRSAIAGVSGRA